MTHVTGVGAWRQARSLTAALLLGTAVLGFAPGLPAHAAPAAATQVGSPETGDPGTGTAERPKNPKPAKQCQWKNANGSTDYYNVGETVSVNGYGKFKCGKDGKWYQVRTGEVVDLEILDGGVYAP